MRDTSAMLLRRSTWREDVPVIDIFCHDVGLIRSHRSQTRAPVLRLSFKTFLKHISNSPHDWKSSYTGTGLMTKYFTSGVWVLDSHLVKLTQVEVDYRGFGGEEPHRRPSSCHHILSTTGKEEKRF